MADESETREKSKRRRKVKSVKKPENDMDETDGAAGKAPVNFLALEGGAEERIGKSKSRRQS